MAVQGFKLSPDGRYLAFTAPDGGVDRVWIRPLDSLQQRALPATDGATYPFFSPDSAHIGFFAQGKLKRMVVTGGPPQTLCDAPDPRGGAWGPNGDIVFAPGVNSVLYRVRAEGGSPTPVAKLTLPSGSGASLRFPDFLPGSERFFFGNKPGRRPWAYWRFDIGLPAAPVSPLEEIAELNARGLLDRSEQMLIEKEYQLLNPNQSVTYATCAHLHVSDVISLGSLMADYAVTAPWHSQRNRPRLREKYERLGERVSERIGGVKRGSDEAF